MAAIVVGSVLALAPAAQAETTTVESNETVPVATTRDNPCTGETVVLSGTYHVQAKTTVTTDLTGTRFHSHELEKLSLRGTALVTGAVYQNQEQQTSEQNWSLDPLGGLAPYESTSQATMLLIRQGEIKSPPDDFWTRLVAHLTYNANGVMTVQRAELSFDCR